MDNNTLEYLRLEQERSKSPISLIKTIWGCVVGIAGVTIPLMGISGDPSVLMLPILGIAGATISSVAIWRRVGSMQHITPSLGDIQSLQQLQEIQRSIADLRGYVMHLEQSIDDKQLRLAIDKADKQSQEAQQLPRQGSTTS
jgi:hypothetical protein